jgi:hypothetical protein
MMEAFVVEGASIVGVMHSEIQHAPCSTAKLSLPIVCNEQHTRFALPLAPHGRPK